MDQFKLSKLVLLTGPIV